MSKKKQQKNGFFYYMLDMQQELRQQGRSISMREMPIFAGPSWSKLSDAQKQMYNLRAKQEKAKISGASANGGATALGASNPVVPGRRDCSGTLISERVDIEGEMVERREREKVEIKEMLPPGRQVTLECFWVIDVQTLCHIPNKPEQKYLPCEIGVLCYSLNYGIHSKFHRFIHPGPIPVGYRFKAQSTSDATNQIPVEGAPDAEGDYRKLLGELEQYLTNGGQSRDLPPLFAKREFVERAEWSLQWLADNAGVTNRLRRVYVLEDLISALVVHSDSKVISPFVVEEMLKTSNYDHDTDTRCSFHESLDCSHCSLGISHTYCYVMTELLCRRYGVAVTRNHLSILPPVKGTVVMNPKPHPSASSVSRGPGRSRSATPMSSEPRGRGLGRGLGRGVVSANLHGPPNGIGRGRASFQFS